MEQFTVSFIVIGGLALILRNGFILSLKSLYLYMRRGEFNSDGDWTTEDEFDYFNPNLGTTQRRYITKYSIYGIEWGFFNDEGYVKKTSTWFEWAEDTKNRFPVAQPINCNSKKEFLANLMRNNK